MTNLTFTGGEEGGSSDQEHLEGMDFVLQFAQFRRDPNDPDRLATFQNLEWGYEEDGGTVYKRGEGGARTLVPPEAAAGLYTAKGYMEFSIVAAVAPGGGYDFSYFGESLPYAVALKGIEILGPKQVEFKNEGDMKAAMLSIPGKCGLDVASLNPNSIGADPNYLIREGEALAAILAEENRDVTYDDAVFYIIGVKIKEAAANGHLVAASTGARSTFLRYQSFQPLPKARCDEIWQQYRAYTSQQAVPAASPAPVESPVPAASPAPQATNDGAEALRALIRQAASQGRVSGAEVVTWAREGASVEVATAIETAVAASKSVLEVLPQATLQAVWDRIKPPAEAVL